MTCRLLRQAANTDRTHHALMQPFCLCLCIILAVAGACPAATTDKLPTQSNR